MGACCAGNARWRYLRSFPAFPPLAVFLGGEAVSLASRGYPLRCGVQGWSVRLSVRFIGTLLLCFYLSCGGKGGSPITNSILGKAVTRIRKISRRVTVALSQEGC